MCSYGESDCRFLCTYAVKATVAFTVLVHSYGESDGLQAPPRGESDGLKAPPRGESNMFVMFSGESDTFVMTSHGESSGFAALSPRDRGESTSLPSRRGI